MVNRQNMMIVLESDDPARRLAAMALAETLGLTVRDASDSERANPQTAGDEPLILALRSDGLEVRDAHMKPGRGLMVDFTEINPRQASKRGGFSRKQPLARAIGKSTRTVLDATAGLGHDSALLACMGFHVTAVERSPIIAALLEDGLRRAMLDEDLKHALDDRLTIIQADARDILRRGSIRPDAVYIDPMFPPKRKASALAKKSIRLVRQIVGDDDDAADLLATAQLHAPRVVVKRPNHAKPLAPKPTAQIAGKLVRYDVYVNAS